MQAYRHLAELMVAGGEVDDSHVRSAALGPVHVLLVQCLEEVDIAAHCPTMSSAAEGRAENMQ